MGISPKLFASKGVLLVLATTTVVLWTHIWNVFNVNRGLDVAQKEGPKIKASHVIVEPDDFIYSYHWEAAPIVNTEFKIIFFTVPKVGCTVWKQLFLRMAGDASWRRMDDQLHDPSKNGLQYLFHFNISEATRLMNDPEYTRAIFLRDPKERFLSAYLDKAVRGDPSYVASHCCQKDDLQCQEQSRAFPGFVEVSNKCEDQHWRPYSARMEPKYIPTIDFVGHMETAAQDTEALLRKVGAWRRFGAKNWGVSRNESIFASTGTVPHATSKTAADSWSRLSKYYTPSLESMVERKYASDYAIAKFNLPKRKIDFNSMDRSKK